MIVQLLQALFVLVLLGNMLAFAGVDPISRFVTAGIALFFALQLRRLPALPRFHRTALWGLAALVFLQLVPLPHVVRALIQPGFAEVSAAGWAPLSLAPWATVHMTASLVVAALIACQAARMAQTRSGLPVLLVTIAATGVLAAMLGLVAESTDPSKVLFFRDNVFGGGVYGPFVNRNHFAQAMELTIPAAIALLAVAIRRLPERGLVRQKAVVSALASGIAIAVCLATLLRSSSRGGILFMALALVMTVPWWQRLKHRSRRWPALVMAALLVVIIGSLSWTRIPDIQERVADLVAVEGLEGNTRIDLWRGTVASWKRSPILGSGLGTYRYVIGMDKPASGAAALEQAHNDWLEWGATSGLVGMVLLGALVFGLGQILMPGRVRNLRAELRYALAGATLALVATMMHEMIGFGLQTPVNRYLLAAWVGLVLGLWERSSGRKRRTTEAPT
ncbi:MAG: O-antigen ligase family protein [Acidobacteria bacterium]|nr:O-antigen ligase family protein [Acidobacteriota bacterium]